MSKKIIQKIAVLVNLIDSDKMLILNGIKISSLFKKELCLVFHLKRKIKYKQIKQELNDYQAAIKKEIPGLNVSTLILQAAAREIPEQLADEHEAILLIIDSGKYKRYSKAVYHSPVPILFIKPGTVLSSFKKIILPVDLRKGNSETALWSSYFGKFNESEIFILAANHKGDYERKQVAKNIALINNLMQRLHIRHEIFKGSKSSLHNSFEALDVALSSKCDLLVILGSSTITPLDIIIGLPEKKIIKKAGNLPVLLVNSMRDNYLLCQ
jgi:hypothetical protein